jgi:hypothetical protein
MSAVKLSPPAHIAPASEGSRNDLLDQIRRGAVLKKVDPNAALPSLGNLTSEQSNSLADILARAMNTRRIGLHEEGGKEVHGSNGDDDDDDGSDWD